MQGIVDVILAFCFVNCIAVQASNNVEEKLLDKVAELDQKVKQLEFNVNKIGHASYQDKEEILATVRNLEQKVFRLEQEIYMQKRDKVSTRCEDGWKYYDGSCYLLVEDELPFLKAEVECINHNANLVHINNADENTFLKTYLSESKGSNVWIGLTDVLKRGIFQWIDDKSTPYFEDWARNRPVSSKTGMAHCVNMLAGRNYEWLDRICADPLMFICEKKMTDLK